MSDNANSAKTDTSEPHFKVKVKQEKIDPDIRNLENNFFNKTQTENIETKPTTLEQNKSSDENDESPSEDSDTISKHEAEDDKKAIQPVKSSNEILAELFKVFNAAPPTELLDDSNLLKKSRKSKKVKKEKKHKKHKKSKSGDECTDEEANNDGTKQKHKKKKKHKHKHKNDKEKHKDRARVKEEKIGKDKERRPLDDERHKEFEKAKDSRPEKAITQSSTTASSEHKVFGGHDRKRNADNVSRETQVNEPSAKYSRSERSERTNNERGEREKERAHNSFYNGRERDRLIRREGSVDRKRHSAHVNLKSDKTHYKDNYASDISLSDEETFLRERESERRRRLSGAHDTGTSTSTSTNHGHGRTHNNHHSNSNNNSFYNSSNRRGDRNNDKRYAHRHRTRSRSRSRSRSRDLGIDKKRLLEIARKNAISMFKRGSLPGSDAMTQELKDKVLLKMRYGGRTVQDLTDFCKKISNGEDLSELSSDEDSDVDKNGNAKAFHHPFQLTEHEPIVMYIRNAKPTLPVALQKTEDQAKAITMQFPVSSGQQHRMSEVWVPVGKVGAMPPLPTAKQTTNMFKDMPKNVFEKPIPPAEKQEPAFKSIGSNGGATVPPIVPVEVVPPPPSAPAIPAKKPTNPATIFVKENCTTNSSQQATPTILQPTPIPATTTAATIDATPFVADVPIPSTASAPSSDSIFQRDTSNLDVSSIITKRLSAMRRLQENPMDSEAMKMMYNSQREMSSWATSKHTPGQFTGSTGVQVLKAHELNSGPQMWARRDQLRMTQPVLGGMGMQLLQKMGWKPGEGLGREKTGSLHPLLLDVKLDKRGLVSSEDNGYQPQQQQQQRQGQKVGKRPTTNAAQAQQNLQDKHPVCLLNELASKRKWTPPQYTLINDDGPAHSRLFVFSVSINGQTFTPSQPSNNKKEAKLVAAKMCLQEIGVLLPNS